MKLITSLAFLAARAPLAAPTPMTTTLFTLPLNSSWLENIAYRPSTNTLLATRLDIAQLWSISPKTGAGTILATVPNTAALVGITQTRASPDEFYVASLNFSLTTGVQPNSSVLWKLAYTKKGDGYTFEEAFGVPEMTLINGLATWDEHTILATDTVQGVIRKIDLVTGSTVVVLQDPTMLPITGRGVNGVKVLRSCEGSTFVYYTATDAGLLARIPVDAITAYPVGPVEVLARGVGELDDFTLLPDGSAVIASGGVDGAVVRVGVDGSVETVAELAYSTACQVGEGGVLYVTTGGSTAAGSIVAVDLDL